MNARKAEKLLADADVVPCVHGPIPDIKRLVERCLGADIPALAGCPPGAGKG